MRVVGHSSVQPTQQLQLPPRSDRSLHSAATGLNNA